MMWGCLAMHVSNDILEAHSSDQGKSCSVYTAEHCV